MIRLTRLDGSQLYLNEDLIETIEETPDTHITLTNGNRYLVREKTSVIQEKIAECKIRLIARAFGVPVRKFSNRCGRKN